MGSTIKETHPIRAGTPVSVRLTDPPDDAAKVIVNGHNFALDKEGSATDVTGAMKNGLNELKFVVQNKGGTFPGGSLPPGRWTGSFQLMANGNIIGQYADEGDDGMSQPTDHAVALITLQAR